MVTVPAAAAVAVNVQGKPVILGRAHRPPPVTATPVIFATPVASTLPVNVAPQLTAAWKDDGDFTEIVPGAVKLVLTGAMLKAFAMEAAPMQTVRAVNDTRVFKLFIVFPHM